MHSFVRSRLVPGLLCCLLMPAAALAQTTFTVTTETQLRAALTSAADGDVIQLQSNIILSADLPTINAGITVNGGGFTLSGNNQYRGLAIVPGGGVVPTAISVTIEDLTIANTVAAGGAGGTGAAGGGGGAGLGGALFIGANATVTVSNVSINSSAAIGGSGGTVTLLPGAGGGGGMAGPGGHAVGAIGGGGGGVGTTAAGGTNSVGSPGVVTGGLSGGLGLFPGGALGGGGGAGVVGGGGGGSDGGGGDAGGGSGGFGGGGGGGAVNLPGGAGGFGGGGGGGATGGGGGYGGGAGGSVLDSTAFGGQFGGNSAAPGGGGGAGLGGAIFVEGSGSLVVTGPLNINGSAVLPGAGADGGGNGQSFGSAVFLGGSGTIAFDIPSASVSTIQNDIVDETGAGLGDGGAWSLDKFGTGTLVLTGTNRYSGGTFISQGTLQVGSAASLGSGTVFLNNDATLAIAGGGVFAQTLFIGSTGLINVASGVTARWTGSVEEIDDLPPGGRLTVTGGGVLELTNTANNYSLGTAVGGGSTVRVNSDLSLGAAGGGIDLGDAAGSGTLSIFAGSNFVSNRTISLGTAGGVLDAQTGATATFNAAVSGSGSLTKTGAGTVQLNGANSYTGMTSVEGGVLRAGGAGIFSGIAPLSVSAGATLDLNGFNQNVVGLAGSGSVLLGPSVFTIGATGASSTFAGSIAGPGSLIKAGGGVLALTGANTYGGGTVVSGGVLLGNSASLQGTILNNATVIFDQDGLDGEYAGAMAGSGGLVKAGNGSLVLGSANTFGGGTSVVGGELRAGASGAFGSGGLFISGGAGVDLAGFDQSLPTLSGDGGLSLGSARLQLGAGGESSSFGGAISGTGSLVKSGGGTLVLTGANSYSGGTTVEGGALVGTTTSVQGSIINNALVVFDQDFDGSYAGGVTGSGQLQKAGAGTITLGGALTHTGGTVVSGGALVGDTFTLRGAILNNASVTFGTDSSGTFEGILAGTGLFAKTGAGTVEINGVHEHAGTFAISQGMLAVDGLFGSRFTIGSGATLRALGTLLGSVNVAGALAVPSTASGFTVTPSLTSASGGEALETLPLLTIGGDLDMTPGSQLFLPVGSGSNPTILVGGATTLNGTTVNVTPLDPLTSRSTSFLALASLGGLTLQDTAGASNDPLLLPYLKQDGNLLYVTMLNLGIPLSTSVNNPNASSVGEALDGIKQGATGDRLNVIRELTGLGDGELEDALRQVSGEAHATLLQYGIRDSEMGYDIVRRQIASRRREIRMGARLGRSWWGQVGGERTRLSNADGDRVGTIDIGSGMGGMDYRPSEKWLFGVGGGFAGGGMSLNDLRSSADMQTPRAFGYAGWNPKAFGLRGGGSFARQQSESRRRIVFVAMLPDELGGEPIGEGIDRQAEGEEVTLVNDQWSEWDREHEIKTYTFEWLVGIRRATFTRKTFVETGADSLSLLLPEQTVSLRQTNVVMNLWRREGSVRPFFEFLYRREITDGTTTTELEFPGEPDERFFVDGLPAPKNITHFRGGSTWFSNWGTWTFEYQFRKATGQTTHSGDLRWRF